MPAVSFSSNLRTEYENLFNSCAIRPERISDVDQTVGRMLEYRDRYEKVSQDSGVPWFFVAATHCMEAGLNFTRHLHNGDPLTARTVQVPSGRPATGVPPFKWEESAADALALKKLGPAMDWSLAGTLYQLERYNGWGYRLYHPEVLSPYLWSFSGHYVSGKYVVDGTWSHTAKSKQCGAAVLLRRLAERREIDFQDQPQPADDTPLVVTYRTAKSPDEHLVRRAEDLQRWLNTFPGIFVNVDGVPGGRTSEAYRAVTGRYLPGDPRAG